ncbi:hypothetical protein [Aquariibacter lacus]|uniref:O-linked N-acetylglucosamine transferase, SPINDLY family protein n=1 Tax=Aquariibacter lacus TaxID=2801332 RepID=UPI00330792DD
MKLPPPRPRAAPAVPPPAARSHAEAQRLLAAGQAEAALVSLRAWLAQQPADVPAWMLAAQAAQLEGGTQAAVPVLLEGLAATQAHPRLRVRLTGLLESLDRHREAMFHFQMALEQAPEHAPALHRALARLRQQQGDWARAVESWRQAGPVLTPADHVDLAECAQRLGVEPLAERALEQARASTELAVLTRLAEVEASLNRVADACTTLGRAAALHPQQADAWFNLAKVQLEGWRSRDAVTSLDRLQSIHADHPGLHDLKALLAERLGDADEAQRLHQQRATQRPEDPTAQASFLFASLYRQALSPPELSRMHRQAFAAWPAVTLPAAPRAGRRIRLGYLGADLHHQHPVCIFMLPVLLGHDRHAFEVFFYNNGRVTDARTRHAQASLEHWRDISGLSDEAACELLRRDQLDLLVDLSGLTARNRLGVILRRAAPVQATLLAYPWTTGLPTMDAYVADPLTVPPEDFELHSERVLHLPHSVFCYAPDEDYALRPPAAREGVVFGSFNNLPKLSEACLRAWAAIVTGVPGARLLIKAPALNDALVRERLSARLAAAGLESTRLELRGPTALDGMMDEYHDMDVALDPFPYHGGTTSVQALWMGVPLISLAGRGFVRRMGASLLAPLGPQAGQVLTTEEAYIEAARHWGRQGPRSLAQRLTLRQAMAASPLHRIEAYTRDLEACWRSLLC